MPDHVIASMAIEGAVGTAGFARWVVYSRDDPDATPTPVAWEDLLRSLTDQRVRVTFEVLENA